MEEEGKGNKNVVEEGVESRVETDSRNGKCRAITIVEN